MSAAVNWERRMAEDRGEYRAGDTSQPDEWYTQVANRFMEAAYSEFGLAATRCFLYLIRCTKGFHQDSVTLTVDEFCNGKRTNMGRLDSGTKLSRPAILMGLAELREKHIIEVTQTGRGRGRSCDYRINPITCWHLGREHIGKQSLPIENGKASLPITGSIGKERLPITAKIGKRSLPIEVPSAQAGSGAADTGKKYLLKKDSSKEIPEANASVPAPPSSSSSAKNPHWDALVSVMGYTPTTKTERSNWGRVVKELKEAAAAPEDIPKRAAYYSMRYGRDRLTVNALLNHWSECETPPETTQPRQRGGGTHHETRSDPRRGTGAQSGANGHQPTPAASGQARPATGQPTWAPGEDAATTRARHGRYAAFVDPD